MKICIKCNKSKSIDSYRIDKRYNLPRSYCKECDSKAKQQWRRANKEKNAEQNRLYQLKYRLKNRYNLTLEEYNDLLNKSENVCKICNKNVKLFIDHCHSTNKVRGLICNKCNTLLGMAEESVEILQSAITYLRTSHQVEIEKPG